MKNFITGEMNLGSLRSGSMKKINIDTKNLKDKLELPQMEIQILVNAKGT